MLYLCTPSQKNWEVSYWHRNGIKRFNELIRIIMRNRDTSKIKYLEMKVKLSYADMCGERCTKIAVERIQTTQAKAIIRI